MIESCCEYLSLTYIWLYVFIMSRTRFRVNSHSILAWMSRNSLLNGTRTHNHLVHKWTLNHLAKLAVWFQGRSFEQGVPWHSGNYGVWINSETRTWHYYYCFYTAYKTCHKYKSHKNGLFQEDTVKRIVQVIAHNTVQSFGQFSKWLNVHLRTKWLMV